jgi:GntR family transcriptional regulator
MLHLQKLDKSVPIPLYYQLKSLLLEEIKSGGYPVDGLIPTEKELSEMFQISRTTVRQAITELVQEGWLYRIKSKGTFVARVKIKQDFIKRLETFNEQIERTGCKPSTQMLDFEVVSMPERVAAQFDLAPGGKYIYLNRLRFADSDPIVTVETYLPYDRCAFVLDHDFSRESLYQALAISDKTRICRVTRVLEAVAANSQDVNLLGVSRGRPIHFFTTVGYNQADEPIEYSLARYRGDRNRFEVTLLIDTSL